MYQHVFHRKLADTLQTSSIEFFSQSIHLYGTYCSLRQVWLSCIVRIFEYLVYLDQYYYFQVSIIINSKAYFSLYINVLESFEDTTQYFCLMVTLNLNSFVFLGSFIISLSLRLTFF